MNIKELLFKISEIKNKIMGLEKQLEQERMREIIRKIAPTYGVDPEKAIQVAIKESSLNPRATFRNKDWRKSLDRGLFQLNDYWYRDISDECAFNPECATRIFCQRVKAGRATDWYGAENIYWVYRIINGKKKQVLL